MRQLSIQQTGHNLAAEAVPFSYPLKCGVDLHPAPLVYVPDLVEKVLQVLDQNERYSNENEYICYWLLVLLYVQMA